MDDNTEIQVARSAGTATGTGRGRPDTPPGPGTRRRILDEALALFRSEGYATGSLRRIADRVRITQAAVYYHFPAKDDLLTELLTGPLQEYEQLLDEADDRRATEGVVDRRALLAAVYDHRRAHREVVQLHERDVVVAGHPQWGPRHDRLRDRCAALLAGARDVDAAALLLGSAALALLATPVRDDTGGRELLLDAALRVLDTPRPRGHQPA